MFIYLVVTLLALCDAFYWWWADRRLHPLGRAPLWRAIIAFLAGGQLLVLAWWMLLPSSLRGLGGTFWLPVTAWLYLWHLVVLPATVICLALAYSGWGLTIEFRRLAKNQPLIAAGGSPRSISPETESAAPLPPTRRQLLGAAAALLPQAVLGGSLVTAAAQAGSFRVRRFSLAFPELPRALDGLTIAHLSDTHAGRFVHEAQLEHIAQATLDLNPDLVLFTGDLIDFNLADLPPAVSILRQIQKKRPLAVVVGNHDLFEGPRQFRHRLRTAEIPLLEDQKATFTFRNHRLDVLGLDWGTQESQRQHGLPQHMEKLLAQHSPANFSILLAHHPHSFNFSAPAGIPLTLAGHTHGGQLMLTGHFGAGTAMFDYWSGLYEKPGGRKLVVSNGVGNWLPLRINAPAEIIHITLRTS